MRVRICIWIYMCIYIYICVCVLCVLHIYIYIHTYIYIYIPKHLRFYSKGWILRFHASACQLPWPSSDLFGMHLLWRHSVVVEWRVCVCVVSYIKMKRWRSSHCQVSLFKTNGLDQVQTLASDSHPAADHHLWFIIIDHYLLFINHHHHHHHHHLLLLLLLKEVNAKGWMKEPMRTMHQRTGERLQKDVKEGRDKCTCRWMKGWASSFNGWISEKFTVIIIISSRSGQPLFQHDMVVNEISPSVHTALLHSHLPKGKPSSAQQLGMHMLHNLLIAGRLHPQYW